MSRPLQRYTWVCGAGVPECCKCACTCVPDLRLWIASVKAAAEWLVVENEVVDAYNASLGV